MIKTIAAVSLVLAVLACSAAPGPDRIPAGASANCIPLNQVVGRRAAGPGAIDFEMIDGTIFRSGLASACPGIERLGATATVSVSSGGTGSQLCSGDRVRVFDPVEAQATGAQSYPECVLGVFTRLPPASSR